MSTAVAERKPTAIAKRISAEEIQQMIELDQMITDFRNELSRPDIGDMTKMLIQARAINALEQAITPQMMKDVMPLMNSPLGFKTDRAPGAKDRNGNPVNPYGVETVKRCLIVAWMSGAKATGNEFNIIAGNCYLTKGFTRPAILRQPGVSDLAITVGPPMRHGDKTAIFEAKATWKVNGQPQELLCLKTAEMDARIVVNCFSSSSPDELRGKAEAKLYQRILGRLTGMNLDATEGAIIEGRVVDEEVFEGEVFDGGVSDGTVIDGNIADSKKPESDGQLSDEEAAQMMIDAAIESFNHADSINDIKTMAKDRLSLINSADCEWSDELKAETASKIIEAADLRCEAIRKSRGEATNGGKK